MEYSTFTNLSNRDASNNLTFDDCLECLDMVLLSVNLCKNVQKKTSDEPSTINGRAQNAALE